MKKLQPILLLVFALIIGHATMAQCTPDPNPVTPGFYPDTFPNAEIGVMYDATMSAVLPTDTTATLPVIGPLTVSFCSFTIDTIFLPAGLTYQCNSPNCTWDIDHSGAVNRGCIRVMGTPTDTAPDDSIEVIIKITPGYIDSARNNVCNTDSLRDELGIFWSTVEALLTQSASFKLEVEGSTTRIPDLSANLQVGLYPNPASRRSVLKYALPEAGEVQVDLLDGMGRKVQQVFAGAASGPQQHEIMTGDLAPGLYLVRIQVQGKGQVVRKLTVID